MSELRFTKDGVPVFDGAAEQFVAYQRAALNYAETVEWKKRCLVGPRLQAALEGSAKMAVEHMQPGWISHEKGASQLLDYLKRQVRAPTLAEAGRMMSRFFYSIKRRRGEGMAAWIVRHDEALIEAKRCLAEAIQEYGPGKPRTSSHKGSLWHEHSQNAPSIHPSDTGAPLEEDGDNADDLPDLPEDGEDAGAESQSTAQEPWWRESTWDSWYWNVWYSEHGPSSWSSWSRDKTPSWATWDASDAASEQAERFLPDFVVAWLLLQRSGLDSTEKSVIVANLKNRFSTERVKDALKLTWPDDELKKWDSHKSAALFTAEESILIAEDEDMGEEESPEWETQEEAHAYQAWEEDAQEAFAALQDARRTLREAREKQSQMRRN